MKKFTVFATQACFIVTIFYSTAHADQTIEVTSTAYNVSVAAQSTLAFSMKQTATNIILAEGGFDNKTLFGSFKAEGVTLPACRLGYQCLLFSGTFYVGEAAGYPNGSKSNFSMTVAINPDDKRIIGVYEIGELPNVPYSQYGQINGKIGK